MGQAQAIADAETTVEGLRTELHGVEEGVERILERAYVQRGALDSEIARLEDTLATLRGKPRNGKRSKRKRATPVTDSAERRAGPGNVVKIEEALRRRGGRATQHQLTEDTRLNSGTMTYGLRALEERGVIRPTGDSVRRSREFEVVGDSIKVPPGGGTWSR
jgi:hypothetical protein